MVSLPTTPEACRAEQERVLAQATDAVNEMLRGKLWLHVKTGGVYLEYGRGDTVFDKKAGDRLFSGIMGAPLIEATDDIAAGEMFVRYRNVLTGEGWARPARLFDDGRFIPLVLAPAALLAAHAEALEREARIMGHFQAAHDTLQRRADEGRGDFNIAISARVVEARLEAAKLNLPAPPAQAPASAEGGKVF